MQFGKFMYKAMVPSSVNEFFYVQLNPCSKQTVIEVQGDVRKTHTLICRTGTQESRTDLQVASTDLQLASRVCLEQPSGIICPSLTEDLWDTSFEGIWCFYLVWLNNFCRILTMVY
jgi:hypothetical protein